MAANNDDAIPPVPLPPAAASLPPVEPPPATPEAPSVVPPVEAPPAAPSVVPPPVPTDARPDPYAVPPAGYTAPPAGAAPAGYAAPAYAPPGAGPAQGLSIASMVLGIGGLLLSLAGFGFLPALAAVITGHMAQKRQPYAKPFWLTGIITGYVGVGISLITGLIAIAFFAAAIGSASYLG